MSTFEDDGDAPSLEGLIAATVVLMTTWAAPALEASGTRCPRRALLARKIVSNLFFLEHHPAASLQLRQVMANARQCWLDMGQTSDGARRIEPVMAPSERTLH